MSKLLTEFIGAFFLVLTVALAMTYAGPLAPVAIGVILMTMVYMGGPISGGHYNPAVSTGAFLTGNLPAKDFGPYMIAQIVGGVAAAGMGSFLSGQHPAPAPGADVSAVQALVAEILFTFALVLVVLNTACSKKAAGNSYFGAAIGLTVLAAAFAAGPVSGGAFNPAVGLGLCIVDAIQGGKSLGHVWLYIVGPLAGGALAAVVYKVQHAKD